MLYTETVARSTLELLKKLEAERMMVGFNLAGGTSLSLYLGHRLSSIGTILERGIWISYRFHGKKYSEGYD